MSTINPLFLDSTKPVGDKVVTNVELLRVELQPGESLFFELTDEFGFEQRYEMKKLETKKSVKYTAEVWLKYQHQIQYRFLTVLDGVEIQTSLMREICAGHIISEKWEPCAEGEFVKTKKNKRAASKSGPTTKDRNAPPTIKATASKPLYEPHLLNQIKSLIDDLL
ncbi:hypothetical protein ACLVWU_06340 [Bdellovibrio sp. HCB290]|uniref:hypothetical protein n=1 Tax=Bdellovibrio sp. HCB290 TaxID=3394356 RepID=UPI0039B5593F